MKVGKPKSKRVPVRLRHKIEKASAAKQRKDRKNAKNDPTWRSRLKKDPGVPNLFPYKEKFLQQMEEKNRQKVEEAERRKQLAKAGKEKATVDEDDDFDIDGMVDSDDGSDWEADGDDQMDDAKDSSNPLAALLASATARANEYEKKHGNNHLSGQDGSSNDWEVKDISSGKSDSSRRAYDKMFKQVLESADVICYVLDARDPEGTRSKEVERAVMAAEGGNKRLILILNKADLIPPAALQGWLIHLRRYFPTLPFRASKEAPNAKTFDHSALTLKSTSETLFKSLKSFAHNRQLKRSISVGVIGYPNVGKSSVINSLASRLGRSTGVCMVGAEAGVTTGLKQVKLDKTLTLIDSPGIVFPNAPSSDNSAPASKPSGGDVEEKARLVLLNALPPKEIDDPVPAVALLLKRMSSSPELFQSLLNTYNIPPLMSRGGDMTNDFLVQVARKRGRLGRGGVPNVHAAAQTVVVDWRDGRIQGWIDPPAMALQDMNQAQPQQVQSSAGGFEARGAGAVDCDQKQIVTEWAAEFKIEGLWGDAAFKGEDEDAMRD